MSTKEKSDKEEKPQEPIPFNDAIKRVWSAPHKPKKKKVTKNKK